MASLQLPDGVLAYDDAGQGPTVVFLHGWTLDRRMWRPQTQALKGRYRVLTLDRRGFGGTTARADIDEEVADVLRLLDHLGIERCALVGMSQGGRTALRLAHRHPDRLWALALVGAPLDGYPAENLIPMGEYRAMALAGDLEGLKRAWRANPIMRMDRPDPLLDEILDAYDGRDLVHGRASPEPDLTARLHEIAVPTLAVTGAQEGPWRREVAGALAQGLPHGERASIPGAGHMANLSHAEAFNAVLTDFLEQNRP